MSPPNVPNPADHKGTVLFVTNNSNSFLFHRLGLALSAQAAGYEVAVVIPPGPQCATVKNYGFHVIPISIARGYGTPWHNLGSVWQLFKAIRTYRPVMIHAFVPKAVLLTALAALLARAPAMVGTMGGLGYLFIRQGWMAQTIRAMVSLAFRSLLDRRGRRIILDSVEDQQLISRTMMSPPRVVRMDGIGLDLSHWPVLPEPSPQPIIAVLAARMLWDKGIGETVAAAKILKQRNIPVQIILVGGLDPDNPRAIPQSQLKQWQEEGVIQWWGHQDNMLDVWAKAHIALLPSYREGIPTVLLEAASCGRPLISTDVSGCRDLVEDGANGLLVPVRTVEPLVQAVERLVEDSALRTSLGREARRRMESRYAAPIVHTKIMEVWDDCLADTTAQTK